MVPQLISIHNYYGIDPGKVCISCRVVARFMFTFEGDLKALYHDIRRNCFLMSSLVQKSN